MSNQFQTQHNDERGYDDLYPEQQPARSPQKKSGHGFLIFFIVMIVVATLGFGAYWYLEQPQGDNEELTAYEMLDGNETLADYEDFLARFPESSRAKEVRERYDNLKKMYAEWRDICFSDNRRDFELFKQNYSHTALVKICDQKLDSLDWVDAKTDGSPEAIETYLRNHPDGRYLEEANGAQAKIQRATATTEERLLVEETLRGFYRAYGEDDPEAIFTYITPTMKRFLTRENATKADVADIIESTYNENIVGCKFVLNGDYKITKVNTDSEDYSYKISFSVDQHIVRRNEGKIFGSYTAEAVVTSLYKISSLTMTEVSRKTGPANDSDED